MPFQRFKEAMQARSIRSSKYGIPKSTLNNHLKSKSKRVGAGGPTESEEREIVLACTTCMGYVLTKDLVQVVLLIMHNIE